MEQEAGICIERNGRVLVFHERPKREFMDIIENFLRKNLAS